MPFIPDNSVPALKKQDRYKILLENARKQEVITRQEAARAKKDSGFAETIVRLTGMGKTADTFAKYGANKMSSPEAKQFAPMPTKGEMAGAIGQTALMAFPGQTVAKGVTGVASKFMGAGASKLAGSVASLGGAGYGFDVSQNLQEGKIGMSAAKPGFGATLGAIPLVGAGVSKAKSGIQKIGKSNIDDVIETGISKGIRPSVVGKNSLSQMNQYKTKAKEAVLNIVKNKNNLSYVDEFGESVTGKLPSSLKELTEAVDQTKKRIFNEYSALATKAGGTGVAVDLNKVTSELGKIVNDKVIQTISPETAQYASNLIERFSKQGSFTPEQAQQAIANLNESLQSFYKNPTYGTYRQAQIDALITNNLRESLDEVITSATGPGYAELKKAYGALKTIEKDAIKRAVVEGRKNVKGLVDFTDIFSAGDVVMGVATGNPAQVAKGAIQKAVSSYIKRLNSPDNAIKQMFKKVEGAIEKGKSSSAPFVPKSMTGKGLQSLKGKGGLNLQTVGGGKAGYSDPIIAKKGTKRGFGTGAGRPKTITKAQDSKITKSSLQEVLQDGAREYIKRLENAKTIDFDAIAKYQDLIKRAPKITDIQSLTRNIAELERKSKLKLLDEAIKIRNEVFDGLRKKNLKK